MGLEKLKTRTRFQNNIYQNLVWNLQYLAFWMSLPNNGSQNWRKNTSVQTPALEFDPATPALPEPSLVLEVPSTWLGSELTRPETRWLSSKNWCHGGTKLRASKWKCRRNMPICSFKCWTNFGKQKTPNSSLVELHGFGNVSCIP